MKQARRIVYGYITDLKSYKSVLDMFGRDIHESIDDWLNDLESNQSGPTKECLFSYLDESVEDAITLFPYPDYIEYFMEGETLDTIESMRYNDQRRDRHEARVYRQDMLAAYYS